MKKTVLTLGCILFGQPAFASGFHQFHEDIPAYKKACNFITADKKLSDPQRAKLESELKIIGNPFEFARRFNEHCMVKICMSCDDLNGEELIEKVISFDENY